MIFKLQVVQYLLYIVPDAFIATFEIESTDCGVTKEQDRIKIILSLITGPKSNARQA